MPALPAVRYWLEGGSKREKAILGPPATPYLIPIRARWWILRSLRFMRVNVPQNHVTEVVAIALRTNKCGRFDPHAHRLFTVTLCFHVKRHEECELLNVWHSRRYV
jgi:hypothetical protein